MRGKEEMTEKEKMLAGEWYKSGDEELAKERLLAKEFVYEYNVMKPSDKVGHHQLLKQLLGSCGTYCTIEQPFHCDYGKNIEIGETFFANYNCVMLDCAKITIGSNVLMGPNVSLYAASHPLHGDNRRGDLENAFPITIGNDVWVGGSVTILGNVTVGNNVIIAAGSVVTKDIPNDVVVAGNPAKIIRYLTEKDILAEGIEV